MRAVVAERFGGPDVLTIIDRPDPQPNPGEITIEVAYAGVNFSDCIARSTGYRVAALPWVPGIEVAGRVRAVGEGVTGVAAGDKVATYVTGGGYAEVAVAPAAAVVPLPAGLGLRMAASLTIVASTAYVMLHDIARLCAGDHVLVHSAAGGVGTIAGQLARAGGASTVYGVVSTSDKKAHALKYGYDRVFAAETFDDEVGDATHGRGVDIALDPVGGDTFRRTLTVVGRFGRLVSYGNASGSDQPWQIGATETYPFGISVAGFSLPRLAASDPARLRAVVDLAWQAARDHQIDLPVTEFDLADAAQAHQLLESRTSTGKLLLRVAGS